MTFALCVFLAVVSALLFVRLLSLLLAILVAVWLWHHPAWMIGIVVAAVFLSIVRAIGIGYWK